jgi:hypothetical protein
MREWYQGMNDGAYFSGFSLPHCTHKLSLTFGGASGARSASTCKYPRKYRKNDENKHVVVGDERQYTQ